MLKRKTIKGDLKSLLLARIFPVLLLTVCLSANTSFAQGNSSINSLSRDSLYAMRIEGTSLDSLERVSEEYYVSARYAELIKVLRVLSAYHYLNNNSRELYSIQIRLADVNRAIKNFDKGLEILNDLLPRVPWNERDLRGQIYHAKSAIEYELKQLRPAIQSSRKAINIFKEIKDSSALISSYTLIGTSYREIDKDSARFFLNNSIDLAKAKRDTMALSLAYYNMAIFFGYDSDSAIYYSEKSFNLANKKGVIVYQVLALNGMISNFEKKKDYKNAYEHIKQRDSLEEQRLSRLNLAKVDQLLQEMEDEKSRRHIELISQRLAFNEEMNSRKNLFLILAISVVIMLAGVLFFLNRVSQQRKKDMVRLKELNREVRDYSHKLTELNETKDKILSIISHDLRSPFSQIITFLSFLNEGEISEEDMEEINKEMLVSSKNGLHMLDNLLYWANSQRQARKVVKVEFTVAEVLKDVKEQLLYLSNNKNVNIKLNCPLNLSVEADKVLFEIVIRNVLSNAIKFSEKDSEVAITVSQQNQEVITSIRDYGLGMPMHVVESLEKNDLGYSSTQGTEGEKGAGMGLHLSKEFAHLNGGRLEFQRLVDGTEVKLYIPV